MGYEDSVYLAKLAEQAERYEGWSLEKIWTKRALIDFCRNG